MRLVRHEGSKVLSLSVKHRVSPPNPDYPARCNRSGAPDETRGREDAGARERLRRGLVVADLVRSSQQEHGGQALLLLEREEGTDRRRSPGRRGAA